jgi:hypothetical protein
VAANIIPVVQLVQSPMGIRAVTLAQWQLFQASLLLLFFVPLAMAPARVCVVSRLRHPAFFHLPCGDCSLEGCLGNRIVPVPNTSTRVELRAGHHKTDSYVGQLVVPIPLGLYALLVLWQVRLVCAPCLAAVVHPGLCSLATPQTNHLVHPAGGQPEVHWQA